MARSLKRFFTSQDLNSALKRVTLDLDESHHLKRVLRLALGDSCILLDSKGREWLTRVGEHKKDGSVQMELEKLVSEAPEEITSLVVAQAIPQRSKMDLIVEKAAELGVSCLIPLVTERTIVRIKPEDEMKVLARWSKIVQEAKKQSHSRIPTEISAPKRFKDVFTEIKKNDTVYLFDPRAEMEFSEVLMELRTKKNKSNIVILIGPEGGFTPDECELAVQKGAGLVRLGNTILKTDTAFVAITSGFKLFLS